MFYEPESFSRERNLWCRGTGLQAFDSNYECTWRATGLDVHHLVCQERIHKLSAVVHNAIIGSSQHDANMFLRKLANAVNHPIASTTSLKVATFASKQRSASKSPGKSVRSVSPREGQNVDLFHAENVTCKYIQINKHSDTNSYDTVFIGHRLYVPNVQNNSLTVFSLDAATVTTILAGRLHYWDTKEIVALGSPRKQGSMLPEKSSRKQRMSVEPPHPPAATQDSSEMLWVPAKINCSGGMLK
jgi:hypothetical protein